jgi:hypothetical protein
MKLKIALFSLLMIFSATTYGQLRYGFKTGLNFATLDGPSETDASGKALEDNKNTTGFHIGMTFGYKIVDHFGLRGEIVYSKKGIKYRYDGPTYWTFSDANNPSIFTTGTGKYLVNVNNSYFDIPIMAYSKWGDFEISVGAYASLMVQSIGEGALEYSNAKTPQGAAVDNVEFNLVHNYRKDKPGEFSTTEEIIVNIGNKKVEVPKTIGAYFDQKEDRGSLYKSFDYGLVGGLSYYLSSSLYLGGRLQYGLSDITNNKADVAHSVSDNGQPVYRNDNDRNFTIQAFVGFSF